MSASERKRPAPGMIAMGAGLACAFVAAFLIRDYSPSWLVRLGVPTLAAFAGMVIAFKVCGERARGSD